MKFLNPNVRELLGVTPICTVTDRQIWNQIVTPMTRAFLGNILESNVDVRETVLGDFPGDEVTNLNDHKIYGKDGYVRHPYVVTTYRTENGAFIVKRDGTKFKALGFFGNLKKKQLELVFKAALRDRRFDGTKRANDSALVDFIGYEDPVLNAPLMIDGKHVKSVEVSIYSFLPGSRVSEACGDLELEKFIENPYRFLDRPERFRELFDKAWKSKRAPGQISNPFPDTSKYVVAGFEKLARLKGYDFIENAPSHYHVCMWSMSVGYRPVNPAQAQVIKDLSTGLHALNQRLKAAGKRELTRPQESWVCVVQSLRPDLIPDGLKLDGGLKWPQDNIGAQNLWLAKAITEKGHKMVAHAARVARAAAAADEKKDK
jgi:hypothetical protein